MLSKEEHAVLVALAEVMRDAFIKQQLHSARRAEQESGKPLTDPVQ
jgi:hypothetical protein